MKLKNYIAKFALGALVASGFAVTGAQADEVYLCEGDKAGVHFVIYEKGDTPTGGHMYFENIQMSSLEATRFNNIVIDASIPGNSAPSYLSFNKDRKQVYVIINDVDKLFCDATVKES